MTSDAKHIEIGLTDKSDSARWYFAHLWRRGVAPEQVLIVGDELGPLGGLAGQRLQAPDRREAAGATVVSVGVEPARRARRRHRARRRAGTRSGGCSSASSRCAGAAPCRSSRPTPAGRLRIEGVEHERERARESLLTLADGCLGTRGSVLAPHRGSTPAVLMAGVYRGHGERSELQPAPLWNRLARARRPTRPVRRVARSARRAALPGDRRASWRRCSSPRSPSPGSRSCARSRHERRSRRSPPLVAPPHTHAERQSDGAVDPHRRRRRRARGRRRAVDRRARRARRRSSAIAAYVATAAEDSSRPALRRVHRARAAGRERLLIDHRRAWAQRWEAGRRADRGRPRAAARRAIGALPPDRPARAIRARRLSALAG